MEVETKSASLDTLAVTIHALHVNGKQMTLSVFRQLPETSLVLDSGDADDRLRWWGIVRYHIKNEGTEWVIVEHGGRLFRAPMRGMDASSFAKKIDEWDKNIKNRSWHYVYDRFCKNLKDAEQALAAARNELVFRNMAEQVFKKAGMLPQLFIAV